MSIVLETPRLLLRSFKDMDLLPFLQYRNDPRVYKYQGWKTPYLLEDATAFIANVKKLTPGIKGEWYQPAIERCEAPEENNKIIGDVAFHIPNSNPRMAYIGYTLAHDAWGQGFAREAVQKLLDYLFKVLDLHRVVADCDVENAPSIRLLERLGFRREAHYIDSFWLDKKNAWGSEYLYALLQREWLLR